MTSTVGRRVLVAVPPLLLAAAGVVHPHELNASTAFTWTFLHVALLPIWALLGVALALLVGRSTHPLAWVVRTAAFVFAVFYGALDAINGIAVGQLARAADRPTPAQLDPAIQLGNALAWVGTVAFLIGVLAAAVLLVRRHGRPALAGGVLSVVAAVSFLDSHIYWPRGVLTMIVLAVGFALLIRPVSASRARRRP